MQLIVFTKQEKYYAVHTENVGEIIKNTTCFNVPKSPLWVEGLINLRGTIVTLVNFSKFLHESDSDDHRNIIIITNKDEKLGILVEGIVGVYTVDEQEIQILEQGRDANIEGLVPIEDKLANIINIMTIFSENEGSI
ncbi:chemotaxis protein CheW [Vagococcus sp. BWB3-3]|uniref:Chemotaxis protein CheW n=1 Tax=Vagococcus allomyrinae TaxID=2794353 RepID=A0A940P6L7_9ENTE|nr:chemotaxis protein CheW [Vagococcus allomyrinae]MBP1042020.1 chemotaxis protein CheW [Vagococcus allomyrinae]